MSSSSSLSYRRHGWIIASKLTLNSFPANFDWALHCRLCTSQLTSQQRSHDTQTHETCGTGGGWSLLPFSVHDDVTSCVSLIFLNNFLSITLWGASLCTMNVSIKSLISRRLTRDLLPVSPTLTWSLRHRMCDDSWLVSLLLSYLLTPHALTPGHTLHTLATLSHWSQAVSCRSCCLAATPSVSSEYSSWPSPMSPGVWMMTCEPWVQALSQVVISSLAQNKH